MRTYDDYKPLKPEGRRIRRSSDSAIHGRNVVVASIVFSYSMENSEFLQSQLATMHAGGVLSGRIRFGSFLGKGNGGLDLELIQKGNDWIIPPSLWQAFKAWDWLKNHAPKNLDAVARVAGFDSASDAEADLLSGLEHELPEDPLSDPSDNGPRADDGDDPQRESAEEPGNDDRFPNDEDRNVTIDNILNQLELEDS